VTTEMNKQKHAILAEYDCLDLEAENRVLDGAKKTRMKELAKEIEKI
jgi:hypothetical protein